MGPMTLLTDQHRIIERMVRQMDRHMRHMAEERVIDNRFVDMVVDFFKVYANTSHHGKEENILFRRLDEKPLSEPHAGLTRHLLKDHKKMRVITELLDRANKSYVSGESGRALDGIIGLLRELGNMYPSHMEEEEDSFFKEILEYFSGEERNDMENAFREYDAELDLEKYSAMVEKMEGQ
ncbi:MAG: cation-binding protein [Candidatus Omnitrophica bacterium]|nr:cation-binding protein [Candidatus Omnitrophota bacterium]